MTVIISAIVDEAGLNAAVAAIDARPSTAYMILIESDETVTGIG